MREFDSETGETLAIHVDGQEGWIADELLLWERPAIIGPGGTIMVRRDVFDDVGGFDERMRVSEDWDFCYRVAREYKVGFVPEALVNYRSHGAAAHRNVREMERGMSLFYQKAFSVGQISKSIKFRSLGNFHRVIAGSYFQAGEFKKFVEHAALSIRYRPSAVGYFLGFPLRRLGKSGGQ
jgi:GT2 family glycosyltransferase